MKRCSKNRIKTADSITTLWIFRLKIWKFEIHHRSPVNHQLLEFDHMIPFHRVPSSYPSRCFFLVQPHRENSRPAMPCNGTVGPNATWAGCHQHHSRQLDASNLRLGQLRESVEVWMVLDACQSCKHGPNLKCIFFWGCKETISDFGGLKWLKCGRAQEKHNQTFVRTHFHWTKRIRTWVFDGFWATKLEIPHRGGQKQLTWMAPPFISCLMSPHPSLPPHHIPWVLRPPFLIISPRKPIWRGLS